MTPVEERIDHEAKLRDAGLLLRADIRCNSGCGCEGYDYCAADEWDNAIVAQRLSATESAQPEAEQLLKTATSPCASDEEERAYRRAQESVREAERAGFNPEGSPVAQPEEEPKP